MTFLSTKPLYQLMPLSLIAPLTTLEREAWMDLATGHARQLRLSLLDLNSPMDTLRLRCVKSRSPKRSPKWFQLQLNSLPLEALFELALHLLKFQLLQAPRFIDPNPGRKRRRRKQSRT